MSKSSTDNRTYFYDLYGSDEVVSVVGCVQQNQVCNPNLPAEQQCTPLSSEQDTFYNARALWAEPDKQDALDGMARLFSLFGPQVIASDLGASALTSRYGLELGCQGPLPANQWQLEMEHWFKAELARLQANFVEYATGPLDPAMRQWLVPQQSAADRYFCHNQKILTTAYTNFNTFGLCLTLALGVLIIVISYSLEPLVSCAQKRWRSLDKYSRLEWCANETLQLQRLAHEELGLGTWHGGVDAVPVTEAGECIGMLDLADLDHPRLKAPPVGLDEVLAEEAGGERVRETEKAPQERSVGDVGLLPSSSSVSIEGSVRDA
ncbi:hypothetical protein SLS55_005418 [Diplodia seriata]|uniref:Uncharacterized protein n=1 Tax=Diplodia seriata TaxID=420778 RepID=A0ABR3CHE1_9PEZI